jgi:hypothetical protein
MNELIAALKDAREILDLGGARHVMGVDRSMALIAKIDQVLTKAEAEKREGVDFIVLPGIITAYYPFDALLRANGVTSPDDKTAIAQMAVHAVAKHLEASRLTSPPLPSRQDVRQTVEQRIPVKLSGVVYDELTDAILSLLKGQS